VPESATARPSLRGPDREAELRFEEAAALLNNTAVYLDERVLYDDIELLHQRVLAINEKALGPDQPNTVLVRSNLKQNHASVQHPSTSLTW
jgi:hypothetical protein